MKRIISLILAFCLVISLAACGGSAAPASSPETSPVSSTAPSTNATETEGTSDTAEESTPAETYEMIAEQTDMDAVAISSQNFSFTKGEQVYFFAMVFKDYYSYLSYFGIDPTVSLKEQQYSETQTWFDVFLEEAKKYSISYLYFCEAANDRGITLTQDDLDYIKSQNELLESDAATYGWSIDTYISQMFGTNLTVEILEEAMHKMLLADRGYQAFIDELEAQISEEDIQAALDKDPKAYRYIDMVAIDFLYAEGFTDADKTELAAAFSAANDEASFKKAVTLYVEKSVEKEEIDKVGSAEDFAEKLMAENKVVKQAYKESSLMDWVFSEDREGSVFVEPEEHNGQRYAYLITAEPYLDQESYINVRHILAMTSTYGSAEAAHAKAEEIYKQWQDGEKTEDSFANLANEFSEDGGSSTNGGLYEDVYRGQMVEPFENWCFDESRQPGDTGIVDTDYGAHVMYFVSSYIGWHQAVREDLLNDLYSDAYKELTENHPLTVNDDVMNAINW